MSTRMNSVATGLNVTVCVPSIPVTVPADVVCQLPPEASAW
jgi:hypothetical protein